MTDDMTPGEIGRLLLGISTEQKEFRAEVGKQFADLDGTYTRTDVFVLTTSAQASRIAKLEGQLQWVARAVAGAVLTLAAGGIVEALRIAGS